MKKKFHLQGFTIVEMLVVMAILVTVGTIILAILVISLQGTSKTNNQQTAREYGQFALLQLSRSIRYAKSFDGVRISNGGELTTDCTQSVDTQYKEVQITGFDDTVTTYACMKDDSEADDVAKWYTLLSKSTPAGTDETTITPLLNPIVVTTPSCHFTCQQGTVGEAPTIGIFFELMVNGSEQIFPFQATVVPRNY